MTARRPLTERVRELQHAHDGQHRALALVAQEGQRTAEQTEALMTDHRDTRRIVQDVERRVLVMAGIQGETLSVLRDMSDELAAIRAAVTVGSKADAELRAGVESAKRKASGAFRFGEEVKRQASLTEEQIRAELEAAKADTNRRIAEAIANPPQGDELKDLQREFVKAAKPQMPRVVQALVGLLVLACAAAGLFLTQRCGG